MTGCVSAADLHLHTSASDGILAPAEVILSAAEAGMELVAITDHDTVAGIHEASEAARQAGIGCIAGVELSCGMDTEIHLLGYGVYSADRVLDAFLSEQLQNRQDRTLCMLEKLRSMGILLEPDDIKSKNERFTGRANLARAMVARGYAGSVQEAFDRYLGPGKPAYVPRRRVAVREGIAVLRDCGAVVALAHPGLSGMDDGTLTAVLPEWRRVGLEGIEAYHAGHSENAKMRYDRIARRHGLLVTGGSDSHGHEEGARIGEHLPSWHSVREDVAALLERLQQHR